MDILTRIDKKLTALLNQKETWVTAQEITRLTGWDGNGLRRARERNYLRYKQKTAKSFVYLLESLPNQFIRHGKPIQTGAESSLHL